MAIIHRSFTVSDGPLLRVRIGLSRAVMLARQQAGFVTPQPIDIDALIDTGAEVTCVDTPVVARLGLPLHTAGLTNMPALGGVSGSLRYTAGLTIWHSSSKRQRHLEIPALAVTAVSLNQFGVEAIIGRDVLTQCIFTYDGIAGTFTLGY